MSHDEILPTSEFKTTEANRQLAKTYRDWSLTLLILGVLNLLLSFTDVVDPQGAIVFLFLAAATYFFRVTAMLLIIGVMMLFKAVANLVSVAFGDQSFFALDILFFAFFAIRAFYHYRKFRPYELDLEALPVDERDPGFRLSLAQRTFPFGGCAISALAFAVFAIVWLVTALLVGMDPGLFTLHFETAIYSFTMEVTVLAFSVSLASLISGYKYRLPSIAGLISSALAFLFLPAIAPSGILSRQTWLA